jgi:phytoene dehydrogenase-like protein
MAPDDPTVIIGAGIAGLLCARTLTRAGHRVVVYERESEVGGRVRTTVQDGFRIDHGFQVLFSAYPTLTAALDLPALALQEFRPAARIAMAGAPADLIGDALADASLLWPTLRASSLSLLDKVRMLQLRYFATGLSFDECFAARFDRLSTREFLVARGFSARAISHFFAPFYGGILLDRTLESSASILLYTFKMLAQGRTTVPAAGMGAIPAQLAAGLPAGCIHTDTTVARVTLADDGRVNGVVLADGHQVAARRVVLACDPPAIAALALTARVPIDVPAACLGCTTVYLRSSAPLLDGDALWLNSSPDATVSHAITITNVAPTYAPVGMSLTAATVLGASAVLDEAELVPRVRKDLFAMGNQRLAESAELLAIWRVPYSQYAQPPGALGRRVPPETEVSGLFLASEIGHTSSLEGAARGGIGAAEAVIRSLVAE